MTQRIALPMLPLASLAGDDVTENNKELTVKFYNGIFFKAQSDKLNEYIGDIYIQHNPLAADGKEPPRVGCRHGIFSPLTGGILLLVGVPLKWEMIACRCAKRLLKFTYY